MSQLKAVLWDMDGVIVDTGEFHYRSWQDTLSRQGMEYSRETFRTTFGMNNRGIIEILFGEDVSEGLYHQVSEEKERAFRQLIKGKVKLLPGVQSLLDTIADARIPQAIGSSAPQENIDAIVDSLGLRSYFKELVSAYNLPGKPDPAVFLAIAELLDVRPSQCLVIEDAVAGVKAAQRAGMKCLAVTTTNPPEVLAFADQVVDDLAAIALPDLVTLMEK